MKPSTSNGFRVNKMMKSNDRPLGEASQNTSLTFRKHRSRAVYIYVIMSRNIYIYINEKCVSVQIVRKQIFRCIYTTYTAYTF